MGGVGGAGKGRKGGRKERRKGGERMVDDAEPLVDARRASHKNNNNEQLTTINMYEVV